MNAVHLNAETPATAATVPGAWPNWKEFDVTKRNRTIGQPCHYTQNPARTRRVRHAALRCVSRGWARPAAVPDLLHPRDAPGCPVPERP